MFVLLFQTLASSFIMPGQIFASGQPDHVIKGFDVINNDEHEDSEKVQLEVDWSVAGQEIEVGVEYPRGLPDTYLIQAEQPGVLTADSGVDVGRYVASEDGTVAVTFREEIKENPDAKGSFVIDVVDLEAGDDEAARDEATSGEAEGDPEAQVGEDADVNPNGDDTDTDSAGAQDIKPVDSKAIDTNSEEIKKQNGNDGDLEDAKAKNSNEQVETSGQSASIIQPSAEVEQNLITYFNISYTTNDGTQETIENGSEIEVDLNDLNALSLNYTLVKPDNVIVAPGDTYTIDLPDIFQDVGAPDQNIEIDGVVVGSYVIEDNQVLITFTAEIEDFDNTEMFVNISGAFNTEIFEEEQETVIEVPYRNGDSFTVTIRAEQQDYDGTDKKEVGLPYILDENGEKETVDRNPEHIDWTVRVNDSMDSFENATVIDDLGEHLSIEEGSFIVERIIRNYNNEEIDRERVDVTPTIKDSGFELNLGEIEDAYDITYTTSVSRPDGGGTHTINNNARIILDGDENNVRDEFEGTWSGDIPTVTKGGAISEDREDVINWTVEYNFGKESLGEVTLTDVLTHGEVDLDSVVVMQVETDIDGNIVEGSETPVDVNPTNTEDGMTIPEIDADKKAYLITFSSSVPVGINDTVINTISDDFPNPNSDDAVVDVNTIPTGGKVGEQYVDEEGRPYIEWTITMNSEKIDVGSINIIDVFDPTYLDFDVEDESLYELYRDEEQADNFSINYYEHEEDEEDNRTGFRLNITDAGPHTYEFVYRTYYTVDGMNEPELANNAELIFEDADGVGIGDAVEVDFDLEGPTAGIDKSGRYVTTDNNTEQQIEWTVTFNNSNILLNAGTTLTDEFISDNYTYIADTAEVTTDDGSELDYTFTPDADNKGFLLSLNEATNATITVTFNTTTDDENMNNEIHRNEAKLDWQGGEETDDAFVGVRHPEINKSGEVVINDDGSKTVNWTVNFNTNANIIHDFELVDTYSPDSVTVSDITITTDEGEIVTEQFTISSERTGGTFTISKDRLDAVPYQLTYSTTLSAEEETEDLVNTAEITYEGGYDSKTATIDKPSLGVQKEAVKLDKTDEGDFIEWRITANTDTANHLVNLVNPLLTDTIPADQRLVQGTIKVEQGGTDITDPSSITEDDNEFSINLPDGPYQYIVTFQTEILEFPSVNEQIDRYTNETTLSNENHYEDAWNDAYIDYFADGSNNNNDKSGEVNEDTENIDWEVTVNPLGLTINNAEITDELSDNQTYLLDEDGNPAIQVMDKDEPLPDNMYDITFGEDDRSFTITFTDPLEQPVNLSYSTRLNPELIGNYDVTNKVMLQGGEEQRELTTTTETTSTSQWTYGGGGSGRTLEFTLEKMHENGETPIPGATFEFIRFTPTGTEVPIDNIVTTREDGSFLIEGARAGRYIVTETGVPDGYQQLTEPFHIIIGYSTPEEIEAGAGDYQVTVTDESWNPISSDVASSDGNTLTVYNEVERGSVTATKNWVDAEEDFYPTVWFELYRNVAGEDPEPVPGAEIKEINSRSNSTEVEWENIEQYSPEAEEYIFSVKEVDEEGNDYTPVGFTKEEDGLTVTNTATFIDIDVTKQWNDAEDQDGIRPDTIEVQLTADGEAVGESVTLSESNNWSYTFENLREYSAGSSIEYSVEEVEVPEGYESEAEITDDGNITITNTHTPETIEISVAKDWNDEDNQDGIRPNNVTVNLLNDSEIVTSAVLDESNGWEHTFTNLPKFSNGEEINYRVTEDSVANYSTTIVDDPDTEADQGYVVTNTHTPGETSVTVTKAWLDANNQDGKRENIQVQLTANGEAEGEPITLSAANNWTYTWSGLALNADGEAINYSVEELNVPEGYTSYINDSDHGNIVVTNRYTPETTEVPVIKVWDDADNQDGNRPTQITLNLLNDRGEIVKSAVVSQQEGNEWEYTFTNIPKYENGVEISYSVTENFVSDYSTTIENEDGVQVITNSYTPEETSVTVTKGWNDSNNQDGNRPGEVEVQLVANGERVEDEVAELNSSNGWSHTWNNLDLYADGEQIEYSVEELNIPEGYDVRINDNDHGNIILTNSYEPVVTEVSVNKRWDDDGNRDRIRPRNVTVNLLADFEIVRQIVLSEANNWEHTFTDLPVNNNGEEINYTITENTVEHYSTDIDGFEITNAYTPDKTTVTASKAWDDANNQDGIRPDTIEVQLYANGNPEGDPVELSEENWTYTWNDLPLNEAGEPIDYTVQEVEVPEGYEVSYNINDHGNLIITNYHEPEVTEVAVNKTWDDVNDQDGIRPEVITINLLADGEFVESKEIGAEDNWAYTFSDLPKYAAGEEIEYTIEEESVEGYETSIDDEYNVTNSYTPEVLTIAGDKTWDDANNQDGIRPESITVNLFADGNKIGGTTVTEEDGWEYEFTDLPKFRDGGVEIIYTITENSVNDYTTKINGYNITNHYTPGETSATVTKNWADADNQDGKRPESIEAQLTADGEPHGDPVTLSEENNWTHTWIELAEKAAGETIVYSVIELTELPEYETTIDDEDHGSMIITNSYTPETIEVAGEKTWNDANNQDGIRPESITVILHANGEEIDSIEVTEADNWSYSFNNLPKFEAGEEITYTITEEEVAGYETEINGYDITNTHTPEVVEVAGQKTWDDADNQDGIRPESITVNLHADGEEIDSTEVTAADNWSYSFNNLPKFEAGEEITYTITEDAVDGYETEINGFNITNSYTPETTEVAGTKIWDDADNQDGNRPESITVNLLANGKQIDAVDITEEDEWSYSFTELPKYENGVEINYTVTENTVEGYTQTIDGYDITNHYTPGQTAVTVTKHWDDNNNGAGNRPEFIEVQLTADGENLGDPVELSDENNWTHTWTELDEKAAGETIVYTVEELTELPEYVTSVNDENHGNIIITNSSAKVSVGDYVWFDANEDGLQDDTDIPLEGVVLTIEDENGDPVTDVYGDPVGPTTTDETGYYIFENLPIDNTYTVRIDQEASEEALRGYIPTLHEEGDDISIDSSTWEATSRHLTADGEHDPTLDFGFVLERMDITGTKTWVDEDNANGNRPDSITVNLLANDEVIQSVEVTEADEWQFTFENLPIYEAGEEINYRVTEESVEGYETAYDGYNITNTEIEEPEIPEDPTPGEPEEPSDPEDPKVKDESTDEPETTTGTTNSGDGDRLPSTATNIFNLLAIGAALIVLAIALTIYRRRKAA